MRCQRCAYLCLYSFSIKSQIRSVLTTITCLFHDIGVAFKGYRRLVKPATFHRDYVNRAHRILVENFQTNDNIWRNELLFSPILIHSKSIQLKRVHRKEENHLFFVSTPTHFHRIDAIKKHWNSIRNSRNSRNRQKGDSFAFGKWICIRSLCCEVNCEIGQKR